MEPFLPFIQTVLTTVSLGIIAYLGILLTTLLAKKLFIRFMGSTWSNFVAYLVAAGIIIWATKSIFDYTGASAVLVILVAALTGALGVGFSKLTPDLMSGFNIYFSAPFKVGNHIRIGNYEGVVTNFSLVSTTLNSMDGTHIILRNVTMMGDPIINYSANPAVHISVIIPVPVDEMENAITIIRESLEQFEPQMHGENFHSAVICETINGGYADVQVHVYIPSSESRFINENRFKLLAHAVRALKNAGVTTQA